MKIFISGCILLLLMACAGATQPAPTKVTQPVADSTAFEAVQLYNLAEFNYQQQNVEKALDLLLQAEAYDPSSQAIRNRIGEILLELAMDDPEYLPTLIQKTAEYYRQGDRSKEILSALSDAYFLDGQSEKGIEVFEELIQIDPSAVNLYKQYLLLLRYFDREEPKYLEQALEKSWDNERMVLILASQFKNSDPDRAEEIFSEAWQKFESDDALVELVSFYRDMGESEKLIELLTQLMREKREIYGWMRETLLKNLFILEQHEVIIDNKEWFLAADIDLTDTRTVLFWSAARTDNLPLMIEMCDELIDDNVLSQQARDEFLTLIGAISMEKNLLEQAAGFFNRAQSVNLILNRMQLYMHSDSTRTVTEQVVDRMHQSVPNDTLHAFLRAEIEMDRLDGQAAVSWLEKIERDYILRNELSIEAANIYVTADMPDLAIETIQRDSTIFIDPEFIVGWWYSQLERYDRTIEILAPYLEVTPNASPQAYYALSLAYYMTDNEDAQIEILRQGVRTYPEESGILNDLAYSLADTKRDLEEALGYIKTALDVQPDNANIIDTAAWVYYRLGNMDKALEYIEKALDKEDGRSSFSYHAGMIYHELGQHEKAKQSLRNAVLFDTYEKDVENARRALKDLYQITLEDNR